MNTLKLCHYSPPFDTFPHLMAKIYPATVPCQGKIDKKSIEFSAVWWIFLRVKKETPFTGASSCCMGQDFVFYLSDFK
jgi:hypothetical protein